MYIFILAGGKGTRLFPFSREDYPKQFIKFGNDKSFFQKTFIRALSLTDVDNIFVITNKDYKFHILHQLKEIGESINPENIILEPVGKNTAPAILYGIKHLEGIKDFTLKKIITVFPSDHLIKNEEKFVNYLKEGEKIAQKGFIVTFGITPDKPETGYGYIEVDTNKPYEEGYTVRKFHEKPDLDTATVYVSKDNFFWNMGVFMFSVETFFRELKKYRKDVYDFFSNRNLEQIINDFGSLPDISIDYAVMEKTDKAVCVPADIKWSDVGSWDSVYEISNKDRGGNVKKGEVMFFDCKNSMAISEDKLVIGEGLEDIFVINSDDVVLVIKRGKSQSVKNIVSKLKKNKEFSRLTEEHKEVFRPWGKYITLEEGFRYKIKRIVVNPGESLSLQMHYHRSEHWIVVKGTAKVIFEEDGEIKEKFIHENESFFIPKTTKHRLVNPGKIPLEIIEVQVGEYIDENDIIRFEDDYGR